MLQKTPVLIIKVQCNAHTLTAITFLFSSTHMVWNLPLEITLQLCSPYSPATTMVHWRGRSQKQTNSQFAINSNPRIRGLLPSHPLRRYPFEGLHENHYLPWWTSISSHTARCSATLKTFFWMILYIWKLNSPTYPTLKAPHIPHLNHDAFYSTPQSIFYPFDQGEFLRYS